VVARNLRNAYELADCGSSQHQIGQRFAADIFGVPWMGGGPTGTIAPPVGARSAGPLGWIALLLATLSIALVANTWFSLRARDRQAAVAARDVAQQEQRLVQLEARLEKERTELARIAGALGADGQPGDSVTARLARVEDLLAQLSGNPARARLIWLVSQAEYYARAANAQENLAGDPVAALAAL
jgi:uncharacterized protein HemX